MFTTVVALFEKGQRDGCWVGINTELESNQYQSFMRPQKIPPKNTLRMLDRLKHYRQNRSLMI